MLRITRVSSWALLRKQSWVRCTSVSSSSPGGPEHVGSKTQDGSKQSIQSILDNLGATKAQPAFGGASLRESLSGINRTAKSPIDSPSKESNVAQAAAPSLQSVREDILSSLGSSSHSQLEAAEEELEEIELDGEQFHKQRKQHLQIKKEKWENSLSEPPSWMENRPQVFRKDTKHFKKPKPEGSASVGNSDMTKPEDGLTSSSTTERKVEISSSRSTSSTAAGSSSNGSRSPSTQSGSTNHSAQREPSDSGLVSTSRFAVTAGSAQTPKLFGQSGLGESLRSARTAQMQAQSQSQTQTQDQPQSQSQQQDRPRDQPQAKSQAKPAEHQQPQQAKKPAAQPKPSPQAQTSKPTASASVGPAEPKSARPSAFADALHTSAAAIAAAAPSRLFGSSESMAASMQQGRAMREQHAEQQKLQLAKAAAAKAADKAAQKAAQTAMDKAHSLAMDDNHIQWPSAHLQADVPGWSSADAPLFESSKPLTAEGREWVEYMQSQRQEKAEQAVRMREPAASEEKPDWEESSLMSPEDFVRKRKKSVGAKRLVIPAEGMSARQLAQRLSVSLASMRHKLQGQGEWPLDTPETPAEDVLLDVDVVEILALDFPELTVTRGKADALSALDDMLSASPASSGGAVNASTGAVLADPRLAVQRAVSVSIVGHVDHGKTTLLDALRKLTQHGSGSNSSNSSSSSKSSSSKGGAAGAAQPQFVARAGTEAGGITQRLGAFSLPLPQTPSSPDSAQEVAVFVDTPGHAAFQSLRQRSVEATDLCVLVVAVDSGLQEQTLEAARQWRQALSSDGGDITEDPRMVVALTKVDRVSSAEREAQRHSISLQLAQRCEVLVDALGGAVPMVELNSLSGLGVPALLEALGRTARDSRSLRTQRLVNLSEPGRGVVLDARMEKGRGVVADVLLSQGALSLGDAVCVGSVAGRVKALDCDLSNALHTPLLAQALQRASAQSLGEAGQAQAGETPAATALRLKQWDKQLQGWLALMQTETRKIQTQTAQILSKQAQQAKTQAKSSGKQSKPAAKPKPAADDDDDDEDEDEDDDESEEAQSAAAAAQAAAQAAASVDLQRGLPGQPLRVYGLKELPRPGASIWAVQDETVAKALADRRQRIDELRETQKRRVWETQMAAKLRAAQEQLQQGEEAQEEASDEGAADVRGKFKQQRCGAALSVVLKADSLGGLDALRHLVEEVRATLQRYLDAAYAEEEAAARGRDKKKAGEEVRRGGVPSADDLLRVASASVGAVSQADVDLLSSLQESALLSAQAGPSVQYSLKPQVEPGTEKRGHILKRQRKKVAEAPKPAAAQNAQSLGLRQETLVLGFNVQFADAQTKQVAAQREIEVVRDAVIYRLAEALIARLEQEVLPRKAEEVPLGTARVLKLFQITAGGAKREVAGLSVLTGRLLSAAQMQREHGAGGAGKGASGFFRVVRGGEVVGVFGAQGMELKRFKDSVKEVAAGNECGLLLPLLRGGWQEGDEIFFGIWKEAVPSLGSAYASANAASSGWNNAKGKRRS